MCLELKHVNPDLILYMGMHIYLYHYNAVHTNLQAPQPIALITQNQKYMFLCMQPSNYRQLRKASETLMYATQLIETVATHQL